MLSADTQPQSTVTLPTVNGDGRTGTTVTRETVARASGGRATGTMRSQLRSVFHRDGMPQAVQPPMGTQTGQPDLYTVSGNTEPRGPDTVITDTTTSETETDQRQPTAPSV